jgi:hypothetical protein
VQDSGGFVLIFLVQNFNVRDANPDPGSKLTLVPFRQIDTGAVASYSGEIIPTPFGVGETEDVHVIPKTLGQVRNFEYRISTFEFGSLGARLLHEFLRSCL